MLHITLYINFLIHVYICPHRFGFCEVVISDQGREFVNQVETELLGPTELNITLQQHITLKQMVSPRDSTRLCSQHWDYHLPAFRRLQSLVHLSWCSVDKLK